MLNVPNFLTLLRLIAIPVFLILLVDFRYAEALAVFVAAGVTDSLDGMIARMTHTKTTLGAYLDPAADKLLLMSSFLALGVMQEVPRWVVVIVLSRDVMLVLGYFLLFTMTSSAMEVRPSPVGKASTFFQLLTVTTVLVSLVWPGAVPPVFEQALYHVTGAVTATAGLQYMYRGLVWLQGHGGPQPG